jgi:ribosome-binding protein aMBF1 (putative translation factor)
MTEAIYDDAAFIQEQKADLDRRYREMEARNRLENITNARHQLRYADDALRAATQERSERREMLRKELGKAIRGAREDLGLTQEEVAKLVGTDRAKITQAEGSAVANLALENLEHILAALLAAQPAEAQR